VCGRYARTQGADDIFSAFDLQSNENDHSLPLNWNIAPTNEIYIIRGQRSLATASWGLIAPWMSDIASARASQSHAINARSESIHEKPTFRDAFRRTRCIVPVNGYYEWATALGKYPPKQPFYISPDPQVQSRAFSDRWDSWLDPTMRDSEAALELLRVDRPDYGLIAHPVSPRVNLVAHNGQDLIKPIDLGEPTTLF
jgi:putative SOS response-associated peptidase YedK